MLQGGKTLYTGPAVRWRREAQGTVICIRDAFYNVSPCISLFVICLTFSCQLPVRRLSHPSHVRTWELVRQEIETYAIVFPHVAFSLEDSRNARETDVNTFRDRNFRIPKVLSFNSISYFSSWKIQTSSILSAFRRIYGRALTEVSNLFVHFTMKLKSLIAHRRDRCDSRFDEDCWIYQSEWLTFQGESIILEIMRRG